MNYLFFTSVISFQNFGFTNTSHIWFENTLIYVEPDFMWPIIHYIDYNNVISIFSKIIKIFYSYIQNGVKSDLTWQITVSTKNLNKLLSWLHTNSN